VRTREIDTGVTPSERTNERPGGTDDDDDDDDATMLETPRAAKRMEKKLTDRGALRNRTWNPTPRATTVREDEESSTRARVSTRIVETFSPTQSFRSIALDDRDGETTRITRRLTMECGSFVFFADLVADDGQYSKAEKKARKTMMKLGLEQLDDVQRVTLKNNRRITFVINNPDVFKSPQAETYVIFGEAKAEDMAAQAAAAMQAFKAEAPAAGAEATEAADAAAPAADAEEEEDVDESGIEAKDIELVMTQANVSRGKAVKALKANPGDIVSAIMDLTM